MSSIAFIRRLDGLVYRFEPDGTFHGRPSFKRTDLDVWCRWLPGRGWCTVGADGVPNSAPLPGGTAGEPFPPLCPWRSWKAGKSYLYDLRRVARTTPEELDTLRSFRFADPARGIASGTTGEASQASNSPWKYDS